MTGILTLLGLRTTPVELTVGACVEFDDNGIPWRGSGTEGSPFYFWDPNLIVELDGIRPERCIEFDRRGGWIRVRCGDDTVEQQFGRVTAHYESGSR